MAELKNIRLGDLLVEAGAIKQEDLVNALAQQKGTNLRLGAILIKNGTITEKSLAEALSRQLKIPMVSLARYKPSSESIRVMPESVARRIEAVPLSVTETGALSIAMSDPLNVLGLDELRMMTGREFELSVATVSDIKRALDQFYKVQVSLSDAIVEIVDDRRARATTEALNVADISVDDAPVVRLVNSILEEAVKDGASDIHIESSERNSRVRYRIDGALFDALEYPKNLHLSVCSRIKIMSGMDIAERRKPQDGRLLIKIGPRRVDLRVSSLPAVNGEKIVMRILDQSNAMVGLEKLGLAHSEKEKLEEIVNVPYGIILVTGPTGSGKSTTLYSVLEILNKPETNIITIEDPVEYTINGVNQVQVHERINLTFSEVLRSILRQDPDKIMVGEIRDEETASLAMRAALTGHMVLSTLHTNDAPSAVARLLDMKLQPFLLASALVAVIAQRLVRTLCVECSKEIVAPDSLAADLGVPKGTLVHQPVGCEVCRNTGYKGRTAIFEMMVVNPEVQQAISSLKTAQEIRDIAARNGMKTLRSSGLEKVLNGTTSAEEMLSVTIF